MTLTASELKLLLEALDSAVSRHQTQADFYEARPQRFSREAVALHANKAEAMQALACKLSAIKPRRDVLEVA